MSKAKTHAFKGIMFSEVPKDIVEALNIQPGDHLEFQQIAKGVVGVYKHGNGPEEERMLVEKEIDVLRKINGIYYKTRTIAHANKVLTPEEQKTFNDLLNRRIIYKYYRDNNELLGISRPYLQLVIKPKKETKDILENGFLVIENDNEAANISKMITKAGKQDDIRGVKGFSGKYYIVTKELLGEQEPKILESLDGKKSIEEVAQEIKEGTALVQACIEVLREEGAVIEKKKGAYERV